MRLMDKISDIRRYVTSRHGSGRRLSFPGSYLFALLTVAAAALLRFWMSGPLGSTPFLAFYPALVLAAAFGGLGPGLLAVLISWLCVTLFFDSTPRFIGLSNPAELGRLLVFLSGGLGVSLVCEAQLRGQERILKQAQDLEKLGKLTDSGPFMIRDDQDRIVHWSEGCSRLYGFAREQALGQVSFSLLKTRFPAPLEDIHALLRRTGQWEGELTHIRADGTALVVASLWILHNRTSIPAVLEISTDITRLKEAEDALRRSEEQMRVATMAAEIGVWSWKSGENKVTVSANWRRLYGVDPEAQVTFRTWRDAIHPEDRDRVLKEHNAITQANPEFSIEYRVLNPDGITRWIVDRGRTRFDSRGQPIEMAGINLDITKRKRAEEALLHTSHELARSNKDLESFAYIASHDLQEPLRTIAGFLQLLEQKAGNQLDDKAKQYIQFAVDGSKRMHQMITDLLAYSRAGMQSNTPRAVDLRASLEQAMASIRKSIEDSGASVVIGDLPSVRADPTQMLQVFQNLLGNAIKFRSERPLEIEVGAEQEQHFWKLWIKDNGIGFDPEFQDKIFQIFQRLHSRQKYSGSGIGLSICKKIIERHGGNIWVETKPNIGSTFYFTLPSG
jgi:PAS domain S-box-containing protein